MVSMNTGIETDALDNRCDQDVGDPTGVMNTRILTSANSSKSNADGGTDKLNFILPKALLSSIVEELTP